MMIMLMDMREIAPRHGHRRWPVLHVRRIGGFGGPFLIGLLGVVGGGFALPLMVLLGSIGDRRICVALRE